MSVPTYRDLRAAAAQVVDAGTQFDQHVLAAILAAAAGEAIPLADATGLAPAALDVLLASFFPGYDRTVLGLAGPAPERSDEETLLIDLLAGHAGAEPAAAWLPTLIARRAMRPDHLWQDLGLDSRAELGRLLARHFPTLHAGNTTNMRWKKYLYRRLCEAEGFALCTAPSCAECCDFADCFGSEDGESRLAEMRRSLDIAA